MLSHLYLRMSAVEPSAWRAVVAVLRAEPGLEVDQVVDLDRGAEVLAAQPARGRDHVEQLVVVRPQHRQRVVLGGRLPVEDGVGQLVEERRRSCGQYADRDRTVSQRRPRHRSGAASADARTPFVADGEKGVRCSGREVVTVRNEGRGPPRGSHRRPTHGRRWSATRQSPNGRAAPDHYPRAVERNHQILVRRWVHPSLTGARVWTDAWARGIKRPEAGAPDMGSPSTDLHPSTPVSIRVTTVSPIW